MAETRRQVPDVETFEKTAIAALARLRADVVLRKDPAGGEQQRILLVYTRAAMRPGRPEPEPEHPIEPLEVPEEPEPEPLPLLEESDQSFIDALTGILSSDLVEGVLAWRPDHPEAWYRLGACRQQLDQPRRPGPPESSRANWHEIRRRSPRDCAARHGHSWFHRRLP